MGVMDLRRRIMLNEPHIVTTTPAGIANFATDLIAPLKSCKVEFSPVQAGTGDPSPENVRPISGWTGCNVVRTEINVWDEQWEVGSFSFIKGEIYPATDRIRSKNYIPVKPSTSYYFKFPELMRVLFYDADKNFIGVWEDNSWLPARSNTTPSNCHFIKFAMSASYGTVYNNDISINYPSTDTSYRPYTGSTIPIDWTTEAGTVYGGYVDVVKGEVVAETKKITATRFTGFFTSSDIAYVVYVSVLDGNHTPPVDKTHLMVSNEFVYTRSGYNRMSPYEYGGSSGAASSFSFALPKTITSMAEANAWAAANPIEFTYYLATPITYQLTPAQLKTLRGTNNIWSDANGDTTVKYWTH